MSALTTAQKQQIDDRFQVDAEALLDPADLRTPAGVRHTLGSLWSQLLDSRRHQVSVRLKDCVATQAVSSYLLAVGRPMTLVAAHIGFAVIPADAAGTIVLELVRREGANSVEMQSGASVDLETLCVANNTSYDIPLAAVANRRCVAGEVILATITSNGAGMTGGTDGILTLEFEPTEV